MKIDYKSKEQMYFSNTREELFPFIPEGIKKALDVGCSSGRFSAALKSDFKVQEVWGIEPFPDAANQASDKLDRLFVSSIEDALPQLPNGYFDCIFFNDVLEHLVDPFEVMISIHKNLVKGGLVFASIPNILQLENIWKIIKNRDWRYESYGIMDRTHLRFFTRISIIRLFEESGYEVKSIHGVNPKIGRKLKILKIFIGKRAFDFEFTQFVVIAKKI